MQDVKRDPADSAASTGNELRKKRPLTLLFLALLAILLWHQILLSWPFFLSSLETLLLVPGVAVKNKTSTMERSANHNNELPFEGDSHLFGFFFQVHKHPKATLETIKDMARYMPNYPIYMISSAGYNYTPLASRFANIIVEYHHSNVNANIRRGRELRIWFDRVKYVAEHCNCSYLVFLEDDVRIYQSLPEQRPPDDAGGVAAHEWLSAGVFPQEMYAKLNNTASWSYNNSGLCGGSYVRTAAFLDAYHHTPWDVWEELKVYSPKFLGSYNDVTLAAIMMHRGYTVRPWAQVAEWNRPLSSSNKNATFQHGNKSWYETPLTEEDGPVIDESTEDLCSLFICRNNKAAGQTIIINGTAMKLINGNVVGPPQLQHSK